MTDLQSVDLVKVPAGQTFTYFQRHCPNLDIWNPHIVIATVWPWFIRNVQDSHNNIDRQTFWIDDLYVKFYEYATHVYNKPYIPSET